MDQTRKLTDQMIRRIGAAFTIFGLVLGNVVLAYVPDPYYGATRLALLLIPTGAAFFTAYSSNANGLLAALLYIPLVIALALVLTLLALLAGIDVGVSGASGVANLMGLIALLFSPPIALGALAGWGLRQWRG